MGSARSIPDWIDEKTDLDTCKRMAGDRFDPERWERLSMNGFIDRHVLEHEALRVERYDGEKDGRGLRHGIGTCVGSDRDQYMGEWLLHMRHGLGVQKRAVRKGEGGGHYEGGWRKGRPDGLGHERDGVGTEYWGEWRAGKYEGLGVLQLADSYAFQGHFAGGLPHGLGVYVRPTGQRVPGRYEHGEPVEEGPSVLAEAERAATDAQAARERAVNAQEQARQVAAKAPVSQAAQAAAAREQREADG